MFIETSAKTGYNVKQVENLFSRDSLGLIAPSESTLDAFCLLLSPPVASWHVSASTLHIASYCAPLPDTRAHHGFTATVFCVLLLTDSLKILQLSECLCMWSTWRNWGDLRLKICSLFRTTSLSNTCEWRMQCARSEQRIWSGMVDKSQKRGIDEVRPWMKNILRAEATDRLWKTIFYTVTSTLTYQRSSVDGRHACEHNRATCL